MDLAVLQPRQQQGGCEVCTDQCIFSLLQQKKSKDHFGLEGDEESTMLEDSVSPKK